MSARRRTPPPREGRGALAAAIVTTIAVPGVGHLYMNLLARGLIWLVGNLAILLILVQGDVATGSVLAVLGVLRAAAVLDLLVALHLARRGPGADGTA